MSFAAFVSCVASSYCDTTTYSSHRFLSHKTINQTIFFESVMDTYTFVRNFASPLKSQNRFYFQKWVSSHVYIYPSIWAPHTNLASNCCVDESDAINYPSESSQIWRNCTNISKGSSYDPWIVGIPLASNRCNNKSFDIANKTIIKRAKRFVNYKLLPVETLFSKFNCLVLTTGILLAFAIIFNRVCSPLRNAIWMSTAGLRNHIYFQ